MELKGTIIAIDVIQKGVSKSGKEWQKQGFAIETKDQYPKKVYLTVMGDKVNDLSYYKIGNEVTVGINIESREYNGKWYTDISAWKLQGDASNKTASTNQSETDDLPF